MTGWTWTYYNDHEDEKEKRKGQIQNAICKMQNGYICKTKIVIDKYDIVVYNTMC
jgi:hypothetical protein